MSPAYCSLFGIGSFLADPKDRLVSFVEKESPLDDYLQFERVELVLLAEVAVTVCAFISLLQDFRLGL